jgi:hypothetical protein
MASHPPSSDLVRKLNQNVLIIGGYLREPKDREEKRRKRERKGEKGGKPKGTL